MSLNGSSCMVSSVSISYNEDQIGFARMLIISSYHSGKSFPENLGKVGDLGFRSLILDRCISSCRSDLSVLDTLGVGSPIATLLIGWRGD